MSPKRHVSSSRATRQLQIPWSSNEGTPLALSPNMIEQSPFPSNKNFTRWWTRRALRAAIETNGIDHPDTIMAHARAVEAWGAEWIAPLPVRSIEALMARVGAKSIGTDQ